MKRRYIIIMLLLSIMSIFPFNVGASTNTIKLNGFTFTLVRNNVFETVIKSNVVNNKSLNLSLEKRSNIITVHEYTHVKSGWVTRIGSTKKYFITLTQLDSAKFSSLIREEGGRRNISYSSTFTGLRRQSAAAGAIAVGTIIVTKEVIQAVVGSILFLAGTIYSSKVMYKDVALDMPRVNSNNPRKFFKATFSSDKTRIHYDDSFAMTLNEAINYLKINFSHNIYTPLGPDAMAACAGASPRNVATDKPFEHSKYATTKDSIYFFHYHPEAFQAGSQLKNHCWFGAPFFGK